MKIRHAKHSDKEHILKFCKNTFSWGDYVPDVWDSWMNEGNLLVLEDNVPIGICHASYANNHVWIEGIRINPDFRRRGAASLLVKEIEQIARKKQNDFSYMLIDITNSVSIAMAERLDYSIYQTWIFYSLEPKITSDYNVVFDSNVDGISHYVKSWRWIPLDMFDKYKLQAKNRIISSSNKGEKSIAILTDSEHFEKTLVVTFFSTNSSSDENLLRYLQNYGSENNYKRIQIICKEKIQNFSDLQKRNAFHLMKKKLI